SYFFFSSRRRHTRFSRDWSSDVCSSDLGNIDQMRKACRMAFREAIFAETLDLVEAVFGKGPLIAAPDHAFDHLLLHRVDGAHLEIGRASCREKAQRQASAGSGS